MKERGRFAVGRESRYEAVEPGVRKPQLIIRSFSKIIIGKIIAH